MEKRVAFLLITGNERWKTVTNTAKTSIFRSVE